MSISHPSPEELPWYEDGLSFSCTRCGACCTGAPGYVWVSIEEVEALAAHRGEDVEHFSKQYVRQVGRRLSLVERSNGDCVFWDANQGCTVYPVRPVQCQTWPFWWENVETPQDWERTCAVCPGSGTGQVYGVDEIRQSVARTVASAKPNRSRR